ncbi:hypothetical protein [Actinomadura chokoriensis]|uniref:Uncharacterized protein n=1 Tax=Actinomadura chokoriensis TaxID=454156 RepID=A0ABV4R9A4_9ACTN
MVTPIHRLTGLIDRLTGTGARPPRSTKLRLHGVNIQFLTDPNSELI